MRGRNQKTDKRPKKEIVKEYEAKGSAWLADRLYETRSQISEIKDRCQYARSAGDISNRQLANAAEALRQNGIKPIRVIVEYIQSACISCPVDECYYEDYCDKEGERHVSTCSFWCFDISEDGIYGILTDFEEFNNKVLSVKTRDGKVLWEEAIR